MRSQAVRLLSGTRVERAARSGYNAWRALLPAALLSADEAKSRVYDRQTIEIAAGALATGGNTIDAGAHCGGILRHLLRLSPQGEHWAFEPIPNLAQQLRRRYPRARVEQVALSDFSGAAEFHFLPEAAAYSSLLTRNDVEVGQSVRLLPVQVRQLDDVIPEDLPIAFIKIDVEGAEAAVLRGAARLLERHHPVVVFECAPARLADCIPTLESAGLRISLPADFIAGRRRRLDDVMNLGRERHEFYYVASSE
jgi:FkbM family methyltransferase